jgi:hypothetical protein
MKGINLLLYLLIIALNLFLFLPLFFTFFILFPVHILIYWLTFDKLLSNQSFASNWSAMKFSGVGFFCQWFFICCSLYINSAKNISMSDFATEPVFLLTLVLTVTEFLILYFRYEKFLNSSQQKKT